MFIVYPSNIDYLIDDVRLHIGDIDKVTFSDSIVRAALIGGIKMLQRRWQNRYYVFVPSIVVDPVPDDVIVPSGYLYAASPNGFTFVASGYKENDVLRNPYHSFVDPGSSPVSQEDEYPVTLAAVIILRRSYMASSADTFQSWSDGEYAFSNLSAVKTLHGLFDNDLASLEFYFRRRLAKSLRSDFPDNLPPYLPYYYQRDWF